MRVVGAELPHVDSRMTKLIVALCKFCERLGKNAGLTCLFRYWHETTDMATPHSCIFVMLLLL